MLPSLSPRESQIVELAAKGNSDRAIREELGIAPGTLNTHWSRIRSKLGGMNRYDLVARAATDAITRDLEELRCKYLSVVTLLREARDEGPSVDHHTAFFKSALDLAADAMLIVDNRGFIAYSNESAHSLLEYPMGTLSGKHIRELIPDHFHGWHADQRLQYMMNPSKRLMGPDGCVTALRSSGAEISTMISIALVGEDRVLCVMRACPWTAESWVGDEGLEPPASSV